MLEQPDGQTDPITTDELARAGYRANGPDRCYHCKSELYDALTAIASERGLAAVLSGANADDLGDWRPGLIAAEELDLDMVQVTAANLLDRTIRNLRVAWRDISGVARDALTGAGAPSPELPEITFSPPPPM
mgnify:CR=1 FL=1